MSPHQVDAALDTLNAERVAEFMLMRSRGIHPQPPGRRGGHAIKSEPHQGPVQDYAKDKTLQDEPHRPTQYIVVSHKPQVFEQAQCLIGVYSHKFTSLAVTASFTPRSQSELAIN